MLCYFFRMVYEGFILELWYLHYFKFSISILEMKIIIRIYFESLVSNNTRTWRLKRTSGYRWTFIKKHCLPVVTWNKNDLSKQVVPITYTLEKRFYAVAILLKVFESFLFRQSKNLYILVCMSLLWTSREETTT